MPGRYLAARERVWIPDQRGSWRGACAGPVQPSEPRCGTAVHLGAPVRTPHFKPPCGRMGRRRGGGPPHACRGTRVLGDEVILRETIRVALTAHPTIGRGNGDLWHAWDGRAGMGSLRKVETVKKLGHPHFW